MIERQWAWVWVLRSKLQKISSDGVEVVAAGKEVVAKNLRDQNS